MIKRISEISPIFEEMKIALMWGSIVGKKMAEKSSPRRLKNNILTIYVLSPSWAHHINALRHDIMRNVREKTGIILKKIVLVNSTPSPKLEKIQFYNEKEIEINYNSSLSESIFNDIGDSNMKEKLEKLALLSKKRRAIAGLE